MGKDEEVAGGRLVQVQQQREVSAAGDAGNDGDGIRLGNDADQGQVTFFSELNDALRRIYLDGRKPTAKVLGDATYAGYSTGHWEGDTLAVDTSR